MATLEVGSSSSRCSDCKQGANPHETHHNTVWEYSPDSGRPGCGAEYDRVSVGYYNGSETPQQMLQRLKYRRGFAPNVPDEYWHIFSFDFGG
jgi:hypothetical protein